ncbi:alginate O-acetyltransferase AlgX-related protein [Caballeronia sp. 15711]|uniref:alginate O-acetyltransferase AlgX-related protein n=1 Tax=Caballeronia sp. 15711 TaxID=3391029 RepID=UPI0039E68FC2
MTNFDDQPARKLAQRDYFLLPAIAVLSVLVMFFVSEVGTRLVWSAAQTGQECHAPDPILGIVNVPNCTMHVKVPETGWISYHYNDCGFRSTEACGPKPRGTRRVVVLGSSFAEGTSVPYGKSFSALSEAQLSRECHGPVEFQNMGVYELSLRKVALRVDPALRLQPDAAVLVLAPFDLEKLNLPDESDEPAGLKRVSTNSLSPAAPHVDMLTRAKEVVKDSRALTVAEHFMFENPDIEIPMYLRYGDKADFLRPPFSPEWQHRLATADAIIGETAARFRAAGVPLMVMLIPQRTQAELLAMKKRPSGIDPFALQRALAAIVQKHGATPIDLFSSFASDAHPGNFYYPVDNHLNEDGSRAVARSIVNSLSGSGIAAFDGCAHQPQGGAL